MTNKRVEKVLDVAMVAVGAYLVLFLGWFLLTFGLMFLSAGGVGLCEKPVYRNIETYVPARKVTCWLFKPAGE